MMKFDDAIVYILNAEGGYVHDPNDPGGETNFGISKRAYPNLDVKHLTIDQAKAIYKMDYWDKYHIEKLPPAWRLIVLDCAVNQGGARATLLLQKCVGVTQDGVIGPVTRQAISEMSDMIFIDRYANARLEHYVHLNNWKFYGKGWAKRLLEVSLVCAFFADVGLS